ncbi:MAG: hypothetical protein QM809_09390 [Gordonia sp. (in: high G+C Gram-positive bacteria)]|uniref:hypothetical protein n=1 Tax=Gordonia sp. (in: high G+C Gram-positive bacteria) TaxID=84139 RepID=UPI0039E50E10
MTDPVPARVVAPASPRRRPRLARLTALLVAAGLTVALTACSETEGDPASTSAARPEPTAPGTSTVSAPTDPSAKQTAAGGAELEDSFAAEGFGEGVGVAVAPVGGGPALTFGDQSVRVAWSTIKVPLALAAIRNGKAEDSVVQNAIVDSDNDAALALRKSLGTEDQARKKVTAVLRAGGDKTVEAVKIQDPTETFGLTPWSLASAAGFAAKLPCLQDSTEILTYMGEVAANQQWGLESIRSKKVTTAVKGGWGPADDGSYEVRQLGLITWQDGTQAAVTMQSWQPGAEMGVGTANLDKIAKWLQRNLKHLPHGRC